jgi:hypothetical protein
MTSYLFKNMLIVQRNATEENAIDIIQKNYNIWFDKTTGGFEGDWDRVVVFYDKNVSENDGFSPILINWVPPPSCIGYMHILFCHPFMKISKCRFQTPKHFTNIIPMFWQFLAESMRVFSPCSAIGYYYTIYWEKSEIISINELREARLLSNLEEFSHVLADRDIRIAAASSLPSEILNLIRPVMATSNSLVGATPTALVPSNSLFGSTATPTSNSLVGVTPTALVPSNSLFGSTATPTPTSNSLVGPTPTPTPTALVPSNSLFGSTATPTSNSLFGSTATPTSNSLFGATPTSNSLFGSKTPTPKLTAPATSYSLFGAGTQTSFGAQSIPQTSFGAQPIPQTSFGAQPIPQTSFGAQPIPQTSFGAQPIPQTSFGAQPVPQTSFGATTLTAFSSTKQASGSQFGNGSFNKSQSGPFYVSK